MGDFSEVLERLERYKISEKTKGPEGPLVVAVLERCIIESGSQRIVI